MSFGQRIQEYKDIQNKLQKTKYSVRIGPMQKAVNTKDSNSALVEQMFQAGAHYGYSKTRRHPSVSSYIYATKNKTDIINLEKTTVLLEEALKFVKELASKGKVLLLVGTKPEAKEIIKEAGISLDMPYVTERWIGGTISNFIEIKKRITELETYQKDSKEGGLDKYTKKERVVLAKKMEKLARYYSGLIGMKKIPDALFIIDTKEEHVAATEAIKSGVPIVALTNSDSNIKTINYPIISNDAGILSIKFFVKHIVDTYKNSIVEKTSKEK